MFPAPLGPPGRCTVPVYTSPVHHLANTLSLGQVEGWSSPQPHTFTQSNTVLLEDLSLCRYSSEKVFEEGEECWVSIMCSGVYSEYCTVVPPVPVQSVSVRLSQWSHSRHNSLPALREARGPSHLTLPEERTQHRK